MSGRAADPHGRQRRACAAHAALRRVPLAAVAGRQDELQLHPAERPRAPGEVYVQGQLVQVGPSGEFYTDVQPTRASRKSPSSLSTPSEGGKGTNRGSQRPVPAASASPRLGDVTAGAAAGPPGRKSAMAFPPPHRPRCPHTGPSFLIAEAKLHRWPRRTHTGPCLVCGRDGTALLLAISVAARDQLRVVLAQARASSWRSWRAARRRTRRSSSGPARAG
jgi:hypothetical protein